MAKFFAREPSTALLVGRVNVGKSTLFNRLLGRHQALTSQEANTTRDLNRGLISWRDKSFWLLDSGGYNFKVRDTAGAAGAKKMQDAMQTAAVILLVIDGQIGLTPEDRELIKKARQMPGHLVLVINKIDNQAKRTAAEKISVGIADTVLVSAQTGSGLGDLLDLIVQHVKPAPQPKPQIKLAILGQTNVGKSSLFNALLKNERSLVLPTPHTTRDRLHEFLVDEGITLELIDTAGLRRQLAKAPVLEKLSARQSLSALQQVAVAVLVLDAAQKPSWQDQHIAQLIAEAKTACLIILNKSDLIKSTQARAVIEKRLSRWLPMLHWAPIIWTSTVTGEGLSKIIAASKQANVNWRKQLSAEQLKSFWKFLKHNRTTRVIPLADFSQAATCPPVFKLALRQKANPPLAIGDWVARELRQKFDFTGSPVFVRMESKRQVKS